MIVGTAGHLGVDPRPAMTVRMARSVSFRARANNRLVTAEAAGAQSLVANRTAIGGWEKFVLVRL